MIGNTGDPATPYEWSVAMADLLASGQLYTVDSDGHTAFLSVPCVTPVVVDYLVDLDMPAPGASCVNDEASDSFPPAGQGEFDKLIALFDCLRDNGADIPEVTIGDLLADPTGESLLEQIDPTDPAFVQRRSPVRISSATCRAASSQRTHRISGLVPRNRAGNSHPIGTDLPQGRWFMMGPMIARALPTPRQRLLRQRQHGAVLAAVGSS